MHSRVWRLSCGLYVSRWRVLSNSVATVSVGYDVAGLSLHRVAHVSFWANLEWDVVFGWRYSNLSCWSDVQRARVRAECYVSDRFYAGGNCDRFYVSKADDAHVWYRDGDEFGRCVRAEWWVVPDGVYKRWRSVCASTADLRDGYDVGEWRVSDELFCWADSWA